MHPGPWSTIHSCFCSTGRTAITQLLSIGVGFLKKAKTLVKHCQCVGRTSFASTSLLPPAISAARTLLSSSVRAFSCSRGSMLVRIRLNHAQLQRRFLTQLAHVVSRNQRTESLEMFTAINRRVLQTLTWDWRFPAYL